jgi:hypothetical protein
MSISDLNKLVSNLILLISYSNSGVPCHTLEPNSGKEQKKKTNSKSKLYLQAI